MRILVVKAPAPFGPRAPSMSSRSVPAELLLPLGKFQPQRGELA
jgi:hypothetical protein